MAQNVVTKGYTREYDYAFELIQKLPYNLWRTQNHEDTLRFYALRLHEARMVKSSPQKILSQGTDWRFLNELKKELRVSRLIWVILGTRWSADVAHGEGGAWVGAGRTR